VNGHGYKLPSNKGIPHDALQPKYHLRQVHLTACRSSTITVLANLVYTHYVDKVTHAGRIKLTDFNGSCSLNIQPVMMYSLVHSDEWISVVRDKVLRYYHLYRPQKPRRETPNTHISWGEPLTSVKLTSKKGLLYYQLVSIGLTQWSYARVIEHIPDLLKATAALDGRTTVIKEDYKLLIKLLQPMQLERYIVDTYAFESGRVFNNNLYCILVELCSWTEPTLEQIAEDYKISPTTTRRLIQDCPQWVWLKTNSPTKVMPTEQTLHILELCGWKQKW